MASYLRDTERLESSLPSIRGSQAWETSPTGPRRLGLDPGGGERNVRYHSAFHHPAAARPEDPPLLIPRPPSPAVRDQHRRMVDMHDKVSFYKDEIEKKDRLIAQLTSMPDTPRGKVIDGTIQIEDMYLVDRISESTALKSDTAALRVKVEGLQSQVRELTVQLDIREEKIRELKHQVDTARENEAKHLTISQSMRQKVVEYEAEFGSLGGAANRSELAINTLQRDNKVQQERILELESHVRKILEERDRAEQDRVTLERRWVETITKVCSMLSIEGDISFSSVDSLSSLATKVSDLVHENVALRGKIGSMRDYMDSAELENKASRETIMRLVTEAEREQKFTSKFTLELDGLRLERDQLKLRADEYAREINLLKERLDTTQRSWQASQRDLEQKEAHFTGIDLKLRDYELGVRNAEMAFKNFKQSLCGILGVDGFEDTIRERVQSLVLASSDRSAHIDMLESKVSELTRQLETQVDFHHSSEGKARRLEVEFVSLEERLRRAESELAAGEALRDGFRIDKERYMKFLERISLAMKMDGITADMGIDSCIEAILARAEQLTRMEFDALNDRKVHIYNLQRKVKALKEQLDSKELHMELLRKKVMGLEERLVGQTDVDREKDEVYVKNRKLVKLVDRYKIELNEAQLELRDLKARLLETSDMRNVTLEQERALGDLEVQVGQLERVREQQAEKIGALKDSVHVKNSKLEQKSATTNNTIHALSSELRTTKSALDDVSKRERQLLDLRAVMSRMLGLDVNTLAVPDYEIIARLEKLILANQSNASSAIVLDNVIGDMQDSFREGYKDATRSIETTAAMNRSQRSRTGRAAKIANSRIRSRSLSPNRKRDPRAY